MKFYQSKAILYLRDSIIIPLPSESCRAKQTLSSIGTTRQAHLPGSGWTLTSQSKRKRGIPWGKSRTCWETDTTALSYRRDRLSPMTVFWVGHWKQEWGRAHCNLCYSTSFQWCGAQKNYFSHGSNMQCLTKIYKVKKVKVNWSNLLSIFTHVTSNSADRFSWHSLSDMKQSVYL